MAVSTSIVQVSIMFNPMQVSKAGHLFLLSAGSLMSW